MKNTKYDANFTAGGLFFNEFYNLIDFVSNEDFNLIVKQDVDENKILAINTSSARKRIASELIRRHNNMSNDFWSFFKGLSDAEMKLALFFVCLKTYPIVFDLHMNVAVRKNKTGEKLDEYAIQMRLDELASTSPDVESWSETTLKKINTQYRKAIKDAGLYTNNKLHRPNHVNDLFWSYFNETKEAWFLQASFL